MYMYMCICIYIYIYISVSVSISISISERKERERNMKDERESSINCIHPSWDGAHNPDMCPDRESNHDLLVIG